MTDLFTKTALCHLREVAQNKPLVAFDFDGTLAPIVPVPSTAAMQHTTRKLMIAVAKRYPTVVISGRLRADVKRRLTGIPLRAIVGNHGMELKPGMNRPFAKEWQAHLAPIVSTITGIFVEDKGLTLAVHYRHTKNKTKARSAILRIAAEIPDVRIVEGKCVVNILPVDSSDKAKALQTLYQRHRCHSAIFVGDDDNDESVFELTKQGVSLLGIHVGHSQNSHAHYYLKNQRAIDRLLKQLLSFRSEG
jgi:trehalose 6-phosphate phosphatase